jgi:cyclopropane fatty-acyl-phospholipid synthase-like methyltransferase
MDRRQFSASAMRNRDPILKVFKKHLPDTGTILEIASGSGEHAVYYAPLFKSLNWQTTNLDEEQLHSVIDWIAHSPSDNLLPPLQLDATASNWPIESPGYPAAPVTAITNINMIHISPWNVCEGLMAGAGRVLDSGGRLLMYGPYKVDGQHTAPTNEEFDIWLRHQNPEFGIRDQSDVAAEARKNGLVHVEAIPMPANNFMQIFDHV